MKYLAYVSFVLVAIVLMGNSGGRGTVGNEAATMAPGENGRFCGSAGCHNSGAFEPDITFNVKNADGDIVDEIIPGGSYIASINITTTGNPGAYGFQMVALNGSDAQAGEWADLPDGTATVEFFDRSYVEHIQRLDNPLIEIPWIAPQEEGPITFYMAANAVNNANGPAGDGSDFDSFTIEIGYLLLLKTLV